MVVIYQMSTSTVRTGDVPGPISISYGHGQVKCELSDEVISRQAADDEG